MRPNNYSAFAMLFIVVYGFSVLCHCQFEPSRLRIVDKKQSNAFVRGNLPIQNEQFQFKKLYKALSDLTDIKNYRLVVISLLNFLTAKQTKSRYIEQKFFDQSGEYKEGNHIHLYKNHDILGAYFAPNEFPSMLLNYAVELYNHTTYDKIPELLNQIEQFLNSAQKTIVYVHCSQGVDRAGYVAAAYKMKNKKASLTQVTKQNLEIMKGVRHYIHFNSYNGLQWYCLNLGRTKQECLIGVEGANSGVTGNQNQKQNEKKGQNKNDKKQQKTIQPETEKAKHQHQNQKHKHKKKQNQL